MTTGEPNPRLRWFKTSELRFTLARVREDIAYYESGARPTAPYLVNPEDVPIFLSNLRLQVAQIEYELRRRGVRVGGTSQ